MRLEIRSGSAEIFQIRKSRERSEEGGKRSRGREKRVPRTWFRTVCFTILRGWGRDWHFGGAAVSQVNGTESGSHMEKRTLRCLDEYRCVYFLSSRFCDREQTIGLLTTFSRVCIFESDAMKIRMWLTLRVTHRHTLWTGRKVDVGLKTGSCSSLLYKLHVSSQVWRFVTDSSSHSSPGEKELFLKNHLGQNAHDKEKRYVTRMTLLFLSSCISPLPPPCHHYLIQDKLSPHVLLLGLQVHCHPN